MGALAPLIFNLSVIMSEQKESLNISELRTLIQDSKDNPYYDELEFSFSENGLSYVVPIRIYSMTVGRRLMLSQGIAEVFKKLGDGSYKDLSGNEFNNELTEILDGLLYDQNGEKIPKEDLLWIISRLDLNSFFDVFNQYLLSKELGKLTTKNG